MAAASFRTKLTLALGQARAELDQLIAGQRLYAFALYTSGESDFSYLCASANTEEGLAKSVAAAHKARPGRDRTELEHELRWNAADWQWHDFAKSVGSLELPAGEGDKRDAKAYADFIAALKALDAKGGFGRGKARERVTLLVVCGDMGDEFFLRGLKQLNPPAVVKRYVAEHTPARLYARLDALPTTARKKAYLELYVDLALGRDTPAVREAKRYTLTYYGHLEPKLCKQAGIVDDLLDLVEAHGLGPTWNRPGTAEYKRVGVFTAGSSLASSVVFLLKDIGKLDDAHVKRMQDLLRRRMKLDAKVKGPVSTLPENIARVLHRLYPGRFPETRMSSTTNRLQNPEPFLL